MNRKEKEFLRRGRQLHTAVETITACLEKQQRSASVCTSGTRNIQVVKVGGDYDLSF